MQQAQSIYNVKCSIVCCKRKGNMRWFVYKLGYIQDVLKLA